MQLQLNDPEKQSKPVSHVFNGDPLIVHFGLGKVGVTNISSKKEGLIDGIIFTEEDPPGNIGEVIDRERVETTDELKNSFLIFHFFNPESAQVVIDALEVVKESMKEQDGTSNNSKSQ